MIFFALAGVSGTLGIVHDRRKWLSVLVAIIAGGFLVLNLLWNRAA